MKESISRLMDGDAEDAEVENLCRACANADAMGTWVSYHVIGDVLRSSGTLTPGFSGRFATMFGDEPTVLAPKPRASQRLEFAWAIAATLAAVAVVGWTAVSLTDAPTTALARARESTDVRAAQLRSQAVPPDYLLAHQEYSPATAMQGVGPYLRAVASPIGESQR